MQPLDQRRTVGQPGQPVGAGQQGDFLFGQFAFSDVDDDAFDFQQTAFIVAHRDVAVFDPAPGSFASAHTEFDGSARRMTVQHPGHGGVDLRLVVGMDQFLGPVGRGDQFRRDMTVFGDVVRDIHQRKRRLAAQPIQNGGAVLHDDVGVGQLSGAFFDRLFEQRHLQLCVFGHLPLGRQCAGHLADFDGIEGFFQNQQAIAQFQAFVDVFPGIVGIGGAKRHLQLGIDLPQPFDGFQPVPARRHAHVDEGHRIGHVIGQRRLDLVQGFEALKRRVEHEALQRQRRRGAEQGIFGADQAVVIDRWRTEDLGEVRMNRGCVIDDKNPPVGPCQQRIYRHTPVPAAV